MKKLVIGITTGLALILGAAPKAVVSSVSAAEVALNQDAPNIELPNQDGKVFKLSDRKGKWTVVYFYPKAGSPGCTEQACAFRDAIRKIEERNAVLVGISSDTQSTQKEFHAKHRLSFDLLADPKGEALEKYGVKVPVIGVARRTTFIIDPELKVRSIARDVDPAFDAVWSAETLDELQNDTGGSSAVTQPSPSAAPAAVSAPAAESGVAPKAAVEPEMKSSDRPKKTTDQPASKATKKPRGKAQKEPKKPAN
jgi:peroxiredoxin Q/BCP